MKVCIPNSDRKVSRHFGKAPEFAIMVIEDGKFVSGEVSPEPRAGESQGPGLRLRAWRHPRDRRRHRQPGHRAC